MIKLIELSEFSKEFKKNDINISLNRFINFISSKYDSEDAKKNIFDHHYDKLCEKILLISYSSFQNIKQPNQISSKQLIGGHTFSLTITDLLKNIISNINKNNNNNSILVVSDYFEFTQLLSKLISNYDLCIYNSTNTKNIKLENKLKTKYKLPYNYYDTVTELFNDYNKKINSKSNDVKYDNIIIKHREKFCDMYINHFQLLQLPNLITSITTSLLKLKKNGDLY